MSRAVCRSSFGPSALLTNYGVLKIDPAGQVSPWLGQTIGPPGAKTIRSTIWNLPTPRQRHTDGGELNLVRHFRRPASTRAVPHEESRRDGGVVPGRKAYSCPLKLRPPLTRIAAPTRGEDHLFPGRHQLGLQPTPPGHKHAHRSSRLDAQGPPPRSGQREWKTAPLPGQGNELLWATPTHHDPTTWPPATHLRGGPFTRDFLCRRAATLRLFDPA